MKKINALLAVLLISFSGIAQTCMTPTSVTITNLTATTADLNWTEINTPPATTWEIEYALCGFVPTGVPNITSTTNPYTFTGLLPSTQYDVYVRSVCSATSSSAWTTSLCFTTNGPTAASSIQSEDKKWSIYPNPTSGFFTISTTNPNTIKQINIVDMSGKIINKYAAEQITNGPIQVSNLSSGVYFCKVINDKNQSSVEKIIVQ